MPRTKAFKEEEVLEKAIELFWKHGYHATSIDQLVQHLGVNRASLYNTFGGKRALFEKAFQRYRQKNGQLTMAFLNTESDVKVGIRKLFERAVEESLQDKEAKGCFVVNATTELIPGDDAILPLLCENQQGFVEGLSAYLSQGQANGSLAKTKDVAAIAQFLFTLYSGLKVVSKIERDRSNLMKMVQTALQVLE
ncbi:MAG: TetR/AcrR family transcriptional regulator [Saprospiraceae bacterium]|nr:TetR/AcrR family transcriptional regulator [Saprospiraceae bacterium]